jgi:hypothetical protein
MVLCRYGSLFAEAKRAALSDCNLIENQKFNDLNNFLL